MHDARSPQAAHFYATSSTKPVPSIRILLPCKGPGHSAQEVGAFGKALESEIALALHMPVNFLKVVTLRRGRGVVSVDLLLRGIESEQDAAAAAQLAGYIARMTVQRRSEVARGLLREPALLEGAEVHLLMNDKPAAFGIPSPAQSPPAQQSFQGNDDITISNSLQVVPIGYSRLPESTQLLLMEADQLVKGRSTWNARLELLFERRARSLAMRALEAQQGKLYGDRRETVAQLLQRIVRSRQFAKHAKWDEKTLTIQTWWRERRVRLRRWRARWRRRSAVRLQAWFRGLRARWMVRRRLRARWLLRFVVFMKLRSRRALIRVRKCARVVAAVAKEWQRHRLRLGMKLANSYQQELEYWAVSRIGRWFRTLKHNHAFKNFVRNRSANMLSPKPSAPKITRAIVGAAQAVRLNSGASPPMLAPLESATLSEWLSQPVVRGVAISKDRLIATLTDDTGPVAQGVVFGNLPIKTFANIGAYFEVTVAKLRALPTSIDAADDIDGLVLGVVRDLPKPQTTFDFPDMIPESWSIGYAGHMKIPNVDDLQPIEWTPHTLQEADRVGLLVTADGEASIVVNGNHVLNSALVGWPKASISSKLYAFVGLGGSVMAVKLNAGASPSTSVKRPQASAVGLVSSGTELSGWSLSPLGPKVTLSPNRLLAEHTDDSLEADFGVVFGDLPMLRTDEGAYFEVTLVRLRTGNAPRDGLTLGVMPQKPNPDQQFESALAVSHGYSIGFYGATASPGSHDLIDLTDFNIKWSPAELRAGDSMGLLVTSKGEARVFVNGTCVVEKMYGWPKEGDLFAFADLLGSARTIALNVGAQPTIIAADEMSHFSIDLFSPITKHKGQGETVWLVEGTPSDTLSLLVGDGCISAFKEGSYFEINIDQVNEKVASGGLTVGVTVTDTETYLAIKQKRNASLKLTKSLTVGNDPKTQKAVAMCTEWASSKSLDWEPGNLRIGDRIGVLVGLEGELSIFVNHQVVVELPREELLRSDGFPLLPIFAVVGLMPRIPGVTLIPGAVPYPKVGASARGGVGGRVLPYGFTEKLTGWSTDLASDQVTISDDLLTVRHASPVDVDALHGVVFGNGPLGSRTRYFELIIVDLRPIPPGATEDDIDGLVLGVTAESPQHNIEVYESGDDVEEAWSIGYDGRAFGDDHEVDVNWKPSTLKKGDRVGLHVSEKGIVTAIHHGRIVATAPGRIPEGSTLWPFIDLKGTCLAVELVADAKPPKGI